MIMASALRTMFGGIDWMPSALRMSDMTTTIFRYEVAIIATNGSRDNPTNRIISENGSVWNIGG